MNYLFCEREIGVYNPPMEIPEAAKQLNQLIVERLTKEAERLGRECVTVDVKESSVPGLECGDTLQIGDELYKVLGRSERFTAEGLTAEHESILTLTLLPQSYWDGPPPWVTAYAD